ncbi:MAG TPA: hypothetical protein G4N96_13820 [Chloroflexi bacterium]|nr:hypothetical protein [Chloroflexota bacterium]
MASKTKKQDKVRVQVDLTKTEAELLQLLAGRLSVRSRADLLQQAYGAFLWIIDEMLSGRRIISVELQDLEQIKKFKELSVPAVSPLLFDHYEYLIERPETGDKQLYLKGHAMSVGEFVQEIEESELSPEKAAQDMDLPLMQVKEAMAYYITHRDLIERERLEAKQRSVFKAQYTASRRAQYSVKKKVSFTFPDEDVPPQNLHELLKETPPEYLAEGYSDVGLMTRAEFMASLNSYETAHKMSSTEFYRKWQHGEMPDDIEFTMWAGLYEMHLAGEPMFRDEFSEEERVAQSET